MSVTDTATKSVSLDIRTPPQTAHSVPLPLDAVRVECTVEESLSNLSNENTVRIKGFPKKQ